MHTEAIQRNTGVCVCTFPQKVCETYELTNAVESLSLSRVPAVALAGKSLGFISYPFQLSWRVSRDENVCLVI